MTTKAGREAESRAHEEPARADAQKPSKGRTVFVQQGPDELVAFVVGVEADGTTIKAWVLHPDGLRAGQPSTLFRYDPKPAAGAGPSWRWPPRV